MNLSKIVLIAVVMGLSYTVLAKTDPFEGCMNTAAASEEATQVACDNESWERVNSAPAFVLANESREVCYQTNRKSVCDAQYWQTVRLTPVGALSGDMRVKCYNRAATKRERAEGRCQDISNNFFNNN